MADHVENGDIKENFVEDRIKVDVEATTINLDCVKSEPNEGTLDFKEDNHSTQYKITLKYEDIYGESSRQIKIEEDYDNLIGFLDNDVIMENAMIKLEAIKEEDDGSFNNFSCRKCKGIYKGYCLMCSTLLCILNKNTFIASFEAESNTIPTDILEIRTTSRGKGVYLLRAVPINVIFGPFEGILGIESTIGHSWKIIDNKLKNIKSANWMKNIVCAASASLKNLDIFQIDGNLYFQTNREITEGEELLTYYDDEKLHQLDNTEECLYTPQKREKLPKIFACTVCCLGFGSNKCLMEHKRKCCRMEYSRSMDEFVLIECNYCKMWMEKWEHEEHHVAYCLEKHHRTWNNYSKGVDRSGNDDETRCLNECGGGGLVERSNNEQTQNNTIGINNSHCYNNLNLNKSNRGRGGIKAFKCDICMMKFTQKRSLNRHIKNKHTDDGGVKDYKCIKPFTCEIRMKTFTEKRHLKMHIRNKHTDDSTDKDYKCSHCSYETNDKGNLRRHLNKHKGIKAFKCDICMQKFTIKDSLKMHIRNKHTDDGGVKDYKCSHCSYETNHKSYFQKHRNRHNGIKPFQCEICMKTFTQKGHIKLHIRNKHTDDGGVKDYKCSECSYATNHKYHLQSHLNLHKGIKRVQCEICMKTFTRKDYLKLHIRNKHTDDDGVKDYKCSECSYATDNKRHLQTHLNKHKGIKPVQCEICMKPFTQKRGFRQNLQRHSGIEPFTCDICMKKFTLKGSLYRHIRNKHTDDGGVKDYKCLECSSRANNKSNFLTHLNKHKGIKRFQCDICMMKFTDKCSLKPHIRNKHTDDGGVKDYKCLDCSYATNVKTSFQRHTNKHKGIKPFQCNICMMKFTRKDYLKLHIRKKHTDDSTDKDYKCSECPFETNDNRNLQRHLNKHKGIKPFQCNICMMKFTRKGYLKLHIRNKHTDDSTDKDYKCSHCSFQTNYKFSFQTHLDTHKGIKPFQCNICMMKFTLKSSLARHIKNKHANDKSVKD